MARPRSFGIGREFEILVRGALDSGMFWHTDVYEIRDGRWQAVWSQATQIPNRD